MKKLNKNFRLSKSDAETICFIRDETGNNGPSWEPSVAQRKMIDSIYHKYIELNIDNRDWSIDLYKLERKDPWPSGKRVSEMQAKRMIIERLLEINRRGDMTNKKAADYFHCMLHGIQPGFVKMLYYCYEEER